MEKRHFIILILFAFIFGENISYSQFSIGGGPSSYHGLNIPVNRFGLNLFGEFPRTHRNTFYIRAAYMLPTKIESLEDVFANDLGVGQQVAKASMVSKTSFFSLDGGTRYYFLNDYDIGFSLYAGGLIKGILSGKSASYRMQGGLDPTNYSDSYGQPLVDLNAKYSVFISFGGMFGIKYQVGHGALLLDAGVEIVSRLLDPYFILGNEVGVISFGINLAYRFDWFMTD